MTLKEAIEILEYHSQYLTVKVLWPIKREKLKEAKEILNVGKSDKK